MWDVLKIQEAMMALQEDVKAMLEQLKAGTQSKEPGVFLDECQKLLERVVADGGLLSDDPYAPIITRFTDSGEGDLLLVQQAADLLQRTFAGLERLALNLQHRRELEQVKVAAAVVAARAKP